MQSITGPSLIFVGVAGKNGILTFPAQAVVFSVGSGIVRRSVERKKPGFGKGNLGLKP